MEKTIEEALCYAKTHLFLQEEDESYFRNLLLERYHLSAPYEGEIDREAIAALDVPDKIVHAIVDYDLAHGLDEGEAERDAAWVMGFLSPTPSQVDATFAQLFQESPEKATEYLYQLSIHNGYFAKTQVDKNIVWQAHFPTGADLEISINLSKPEKNNKDIAKLKNFKSTGYPKCLLCKENVGFAGNPNKAPRENIRIVPLTLGGQRWYLQYSPYGYYSHHIIVLYHEHTPMNVSPETLLCLLDFVDLFPHFFIGSNSDLPIVGGSILDHEHFQGGSHLLPLLLAKDKEIVLKTAKGSTVSIVDFYDTALKIKGPNRQDVYEEASKILVAWRHYEDPKHGIVCGQGADLHSTLTSFARKEGNDYSIFLILRNNLQTPEFPDGVFHAHPEFHHIKKEGIGLIEAAGLFILPPRLPRQCAEVEDVVKKRLKKADYLALYPDLDIFEGMIEEMEKTGESAETYINNVCQGILKNVAVYKEDAAGQEGLHQFLKGALK